MQSVEDDALEAQVHAALLSRGLTVASAESLTGGALGDRLSSTPGASATYRGGVVSYATEVKQSLLGVSDELVATYGVVSAQCARQMAEGVRALVGSDWAVSTTGVAGPHAPGGQAGRHRARRAGRAAGHHQRRAAPGRRPARDQDPDLPRGARRAARFAHSAVRFRGVWVSGSFPEPVALGPKERKRASGRSSPW